MTSVTGYTAARMKQIEDSAIIAGNIVGDNLILKRYDETTINAGNVRGATGAKGDPGDVSLAQLKAAVPAGSIFMWMFSTVPSGWLAIEGQTVTNAQTLYPDLWASAPASWKSGSSFIMPNMTGRFPVGQQASDPAFDTLQEIGGAKNAVAVAHSHTIAGHTHTTADHIHGISTHTHTTADHTHAISFDSGNNSDNQDYVTRLSTAVDNGFATGKYMTPWNATSPPVLAGTSGYGTSYAYAAMSISYTGPHKHSVSGNTGNASTGNTTNSQSGGTATNSASEDVPGQGNGNVTNGQTGGTSTSTQSPTSDGVNANLPPYFVVRFIVKT